MTLITRALVVLAIVLIAEDGRLSAQRTIDLDAATIADVNAAFAKGNLTSERLVQLFLARIQAFDRQGPMLRSVIAVNPKAIETARALDAERKSKGPRSALHARMDPRRPRRGRVTNVRSNACVRDSSSVAR